MGNRLICCRQNWIELNDTDEKIYFENFGVADSSHHPVNPEFNGDVYLTRKDHTPFFSYNKNNFDYQKFSNSVSQTLTQHISDREPEEHEYNPSLNASYHALFISGINLRRSGFSKSRGSNRPVTSCGDGLKKWSSCSSVLLGEGCLFHPDLCDVLQCVAVAVMLLSSSEFNSELSVPIMGTDENNNPVDSWSNIYSDMYKLFDGRLYPVETVVGIFKHMEQSSNHLDCKDSQELAWPTTEVIHKFLEKLFNAAKLGPECAIVSLIFLERLVNGADMAIVPWSWRRQLLACILLASKVLDDQAVWNVDFCRVLIGVCVEDLNALERHTLALLQFNIDVPLAVYARYYFDLLDVGEAAGFLHGKRRRLTLGRAREIRILPDPLDMETYDESPAYQTGFLLDLPRHSRLKPQKPDPTLFYKRDYPTSNNATNSIGNHQVECTKSIQSHDKHPMSNTSFNKTPFPGLRKNPSNHASSKNGLILDIDSAGQTIQPSLSVVGHHPSPLEGQQTECEDPIELDSETEFINCPYRTANDSFTQSEYKNTTSHKQPNPTASFSYKKLVSQRNDLPVHNNHSNNNNSNPSTNMSRTFQFTSNSHVSPHPAPPPPPHPSSQSVLNPTASRDTPNHAGFIRSIVGGELAYSLLRDAGIY